MGQAWSQEGKGDEVMTLRRVSDAHGVLGFAFKNDCSIQAICETTGAEYMDAVEAMRSHGWTPGKGAKFSQIRKAVQDLGFRPQRADLDLTGALRASESGRRFIAAGFQSTEKGHAWAIRDGAHINAEGYLTGIRKLMLLEVA